MRASRTRLNLKPSAVIIALIITLFLLFHHSQLTEHFINGASTTTASKQQEQHDTRTKQPQEQVELDTSNEIKINKSLLIDMFIPESPVSLVDILCHYSTEGDALLSAEAPGFAPAPRSIFFHETSCRGGLNSRQACAVESAARAHPHRQVHVLFSAPVTQHVLETSCLSRLRQLHNINFLRVHVEEYSKGTPVESTLANVTEQSDHPMEHSSDILRIVTLYKWGGVYLDGDVIVQRSFDSLPRNWIAKEISDSIASGIMSFMKDEVGNNLTGAVLQEVARTYDPKAWSDNGPLAILRVLKRMCPNITDVDVENCNGITIFEEDLFYPIYYELSNKYFEPGDVDMDGPFTHHVWNKLTKDMKVIASSRYAKLAETFCPTIYEAFGDKFGV